MCEFDINGTVSKVKLPVREATVCVSGRCVSKCCPEGMVYAKLRDARGVAKSFCAYGEDGIFKSKQLIHDGTAVIDFVNLAESFDILFDKPCNKMYTSTHPIYLQKVSFFFQDLWSKYLLSYLCLFVLMLSLFFIKMGTIS